MSAGFALPLYLFTALRSISSDGFFSVPNINCTICKIPILLLHLIFIFFCLCIPELANRVLSGLSFSCFCPLLRRSWWLQAQRYKADGNGSSCGHYRKYALGCSKMLYSYMLFHVSAGIYLAFFQLIFFIFLFSRGPSGQWLAVKCSQAVTRKP